VLRGASYSDQVPDVMFRGVTKQQPNYAEFIHRDVDTWYAHRPVCLAADRNKRAS
jgi:hypothetical protein